MATKQWTQQSGDWFSTIWVDANTAHHTAAPTANDTAEIFTGTVSITAADAATPGQGTLDAITVMFTPVSGEAAPTLDVTNEQFGSGMHVFTDAAPGLSGVLVARGTVSFAGTLQGDFPGATLTLDIEGKGGAAAFTNTGTVEASNGGTLQVIGTGPLANQGTMFASELAGDAYDAGTIDITGSLTNAGNISNTYFGVIAATGGVANTGIIDDAGGAVTLGGGVTNTGAIIVSAGSLGFTGAVGNGGTIIDGGGTLGFGGALSNSGLVIDDGGTLTIGDSLAGGGTIEVADHVTLDGAVAAGQVIDFGSATDATLDLADPGAFDGTIANLAGHDIIDIAAAATGTTYDATSHVLTLLNGGSAVAAFSIAGGATSLNATPDGQGGTVLTAEQVGSPTQVESYIVQNDANTFDDGTPLTHAWPTPDATIYYTFEPGSTLTTADESGFLHGMSLYQDIADITFATADTGHPADLFITTNSAGSAETTYTVTDTVTGGVTLTVATAATISIDTKIPGWTDLDDLGTADASGAGGYGFLTVLHELGHVIGFGHPGPYNDGDATADFLSDQIFYTDTRQYSVMSYIDSSQSGADWMSGTTEIVPQTPMMYDIGAAQMIYGANTSVIDGGNTFGFNSTFAADSALSVYNFAVNTLPVVTLYDAGQGNTLDLSGFDAGAYVNLNAGAFSNADGLTGNIGIAAGTTINTAVGGSGNDTFVVNGLADSIDGGGGANTAVLNAPAADFRVSSSAGTVSVTDTLSNVTDTLSNIQILQFADATELAPCFLRGTRILTERGEIPVETLRAGEDRVVTRHGRLALVAWIGWRELDGTRHARQQDVMPVRVRAGALAPGQPHRDLLLSPDHALALGGVLIPVRHLLNGASIVQESWPGRIAYCHVELDRHDVLLAEGAAAESYLDTGNRFAFTDCAGATQLHPRFAPDAAAALRIWARSACAPLVVAGPALTAARAAIATRARAIGYRMTRDPALHATADGCALALRRRNGVWHAALPPGAQRVRLLSRTSVPLHLLGPGGDPRRLGVAVAALHRDGAALPLDDARLGAGWHAPEPGLRWTDGAAAIAVPRARRLAMRIAMTGTYWLPPQPAAPDRARQA